MNKRTRSTWDEGARVTQAFENDNYVREGKSIAPDYERMLHHTVDPMHRRHGIGNKPTPAGRLFAFGALAALIVALVAAF